MRFKFLIIKYLIEVKFNKWLYRSFTGFHRKRTFRNLLKQAKKSPYYAADIHPGTRLNDFPLLNKSLFMSNFDRINTVAITLEKAMETAIKAEESRDFSPSLAGITIGLSSGTSGNRAVFLASEKERAYWVALILDRVIGFSLKKRSVAFFLRANSNIYDSVKSKTLSFQFFDLLEALDLHVKRLNELQPTILVAQPSMLIELAKAISDKKLDIRPEKIISVAEVLNPEDQLYLSGIFKQKIHQVYQCSEGFLASTCKEGTLHFNEDFLIIEKKYLNPEKTRFHPIITDLKRSSQPVIRYELNDIIQEKENCICGSKFLAIKAIEGRSDDMLVFKNDANEEQKIFPDFFRRAIILADAKIYDYALIQTASDQLLLYVNSENIDSFEKAVEEITKLLHKYEIYRIRITRTDHKHNLSGNKLRRIKNDIRQSN